MHFYDLLQVPIILSYLINRVVYQNNYTSLPHFVNRLIQLVVKLIFFVYISCFCWGIALTLARDPHEVYQSGQPNQGFLTRLYAPPPFSSFLSWARKLP
jgi:hypothetical protein